MNKLCSGMEDCFLFRTPLGDDLDLRHLKGTDLFSTVPCREPKECPTSLMLRVGCVSTCGVACKRGWQWQDSIGHLKGRSKN